VSGRALSLNAFCHDCLSLAGLLAEEVRGSKNQDNGPSTIHSAVLSIIPYRLKVRLEECKEERFECEAHLDVHSIKLRAINRR
jgi:hypothetical protein